MQVRPERPELGIVIPCYNEEAALPLLFRELKVFADGAGLPLHFLFIDDGSRDRTYEMIAAACAADDRMACISFSRNFGHQTAVSAGLRHIRGDAVAVIDADLQDPPAVLLEMLTKWREGYDVVYGVRKKRKESFLLRAAYAGFYRLLAEIAHVDIPLDAGDFSLMDRRVVDQINEMPEHNRFIRGLRGWVGFKQIGVPYDRPPRAAGKAKYTLRKLSHLALDGLVSFSSVPLRLAAWLGLVASLVGFGFLIWAMVEAIVYEKTPPGWASLAVLLLFFGGIQLIVLGIIGEYVGRIFEEVKNRPHFVVDQTAGWLRDSSATKAADEQKT